MKTSAKDEPVASTSSAPVASTSSSIKPSTSTGDEIQEGIKRKTFNLRSRSAKPKEASSANQQIKLESSATTLLWTDVEKLNLIDSLYKYGVESRRTYNCLPQKTEEQIKGFLRTRQRLARVKKQIRINQSTKRKMRLETWGVDQNLVTPLEEWIKYFFAKRADSEAPSGVSPALMMQLLPTTFLILSLFEAHPDPKDCKGINYREVYEFLYTITKGNPIKMLPKATANFLFKAFYDSSKFYKDAALTNESGYLNAVTNSIVEKTSAEPSDTSVIEKPTKFKTYPGKRKHPSVSEKDEAIPEFVSKLMKINAVNPIQIPPKYFQVPRLSSEPNKIIPRHVHAERRKLQEVEKSISLPFFND